MNSETPVETRLPRPAIAAALIVGLGVAGGLWMRSGEKAVSPRPEASVLPKAGDDFPATVSDRDFVDYGSETTTTEEDLELVESLLGSYFLAAKEQANRFPMGTNREITRVLAGHNPMKHGWIPADHPAINADGELTDRWNRPLHFHGLGAGVFEIRSAGSDGVLFTEDDILVGAKSS